MKSPLFNKAEFARNKKVYWLSFSSRLKSYLWAVKEGKTRWTLILDDIERRASPLHPSTTAAGLEKQALHQSVLKKSLIDAFGEVYPAIVEMHPNTDDIDASGNIVPFGTNLLAALGTEIVPDDAEGVTLATNEFSRQLATFPGMARGYKALTGWCDRIMMLYNDLVRLSRHDLNQHTCVQLDNLLIIHDEAKKEDLSWTRLKDIVHAKPAYIAAPSVSLYIANMRRFGSDLANAQAQKLLSAPPSKKHYKQVFSAEQMAKICWNCNGNHDAQNCKMLQSALADYRNKHLHGNGQRFKKPNAGGSSFKSGSSFKRSNGNNKRVGAPKHGGRFNGKKQSSFSGNNKNRGEHAVHFAGSSSSGLDVLPPPPTSIDQHFAFHAEVQPNYEAVYPSGKNLQTNGKRPAPIDSGSDDDDYDQATAATKKPRRIYYSSSEDSDDSMPGLIPPDQDAAIKADKSDLTVTFTSSSASESEPNSSSTANLTNEVILETLMQPHTTQSALSSNTTALMDITQAYMTAPLPGPLTLQETLFADYTANFLYDNCPKVKSIDMFDLKLPCHAPLARVEVNCGPNNELKVINIFFPPDLDHIDEHAWGFFLKEFKREMAELQDFEITLADTMHRDPNLLSPAEVPDIKGYIKERRGLAYAKLLAYPSDPTSTSWTQPKDIPPAILRELIDIGDDAPMQLLLRQVPIYLHAYIEDVHSHMNVNYITRADFPVPDPTAEANKLNWMAATFYFTEAAPFNYTFEYGNSEDILKAPLPKCTCQMGNCDKYNTELDNSDRACSPGRAYSPTAPAYCD